MAAILVVDDDPGFRKLLETILAGEGYVVATSGSVGEAIRAAGGRKFELVISDLRLPDGEGLMVLRWLAEHAPGTLAVMITAFGTVTTAVEAMKLGAVDFLEKPLRSPEELRQLVRRALERRPPLPAAEHTDSAFSCGALLARDPAMLEVLSLARKVAPTNATVLLTGESGTGKELLARCIHDHSRRAGGVFLALNCAALSPTLIESALFGHEKGAFTGAIAQHAGVFERADGGTLLLDEIGELDGNLQSKLLRVLQERNFERLGGSRSISVDVRLIAATNRDLKRLTAEGRFRDDLYYRLSTFPLHLPPLRGRPADIPPLAELFLARSAQRLDKPAPALSKAARDLLLAYAWPGNVRELENLMERAAILAEDVVEPGHLPITGTEPARPVSMKEIERQAIEGALRTNRGNRTLAARQLGISLRTLQYRLKEYGIKPEE
jgi:DNA-binding NtrC family response regulator